MANIKEEILVIRVSTITRNGEEKPDLLNSEVAKTIEQVVAELIGDSAVVEVDTASD
jgi:hypothetical protein|tara:strand:- start:1145 stop:1315 length:171 start_codon:yes stop_codon:yes gene_type:complete